MKADTMAILGLASALALPLTLFLARVQLPNDKLSLDRCLIGLPSKDLKTCRVAILLIQPYLPSAKLAEDLHFT